MHPEAAVRGYACAVGDGVAPDRVTAVRRFGSGERHAVYRVSYVAGDGADADLVVRVATDPGARDCGRATREAAILAIVEGVAAPRLFDFRCESAWFDGPSMCLEYVPGEQRELADCARSDLESLGAVLARVHAVPADAPVAGLERPATSGEYLDGHLQVLAEKIPYVRHPLPSSERRRFARAWARVVARAAAMRELPSFGTGDEMVLLHGDVSGGNVVWSATPVLIDWEYARLGDPADEIAYLFGQNWLDDARRAASPSAGCGPSKRCSPDGAERVARTAARGLDIVTPRLGGRTLGEGLYGSVATFKAQAYERVAVDALGSHLARRYGVDVERTTALDVGVHRVDVADGRRWVARLFPRARPMEAVRGDAEVLDLVADRGVPAERCVPDAVSEHDGQGVLVTEWLDGVNGRGQESRAVYRSLGVLLGQLHSIVPPEGHAAHRAAGSWHSLSIEGGGREADVRHLRSLLADASASPSADRAAFDLLDRELEALDVGAGLPTALTHPDLCSANAILDGDGGVTLVDWTGAGTAPRVTGLGLLLSSTGGAPAAIEAVMAGYASAGGSLEPAELERLDAAVLGFGFVLDCWSVVYFGSPPAQVVAALPSKRASAGATVERARQAVGA